MGHCNKEDILKLESVTKGMNISDKKDFNCEVCVKSKMTQTINRAPDARARAPLNLIHLDLTGPIEPVSDGFKYVLGCTDDFTGIVIPYMLKNKSDTPKAFEKFIADTRPYGDIKCVRSDGGEEFSSEIFGALLIKNKIKHEKSAPYSPHQNGTAERISVQYLKWPDVFCQMPTCPKVYGLMQSCAQLIQEIDVLTEEIRKHRLKL